MSAPRPDISQETVRTWSNGYQDGRSPYVDAAVARQALYILVFHQIVESPVSGPSPQWSRANFRALIDYIVMRKVRTVMITDVVS